MEGRMKMMGKEEKAIYAEMLLKNHQLCDQYVQIPSWKFAYALSSEMEGSPE